MFEPPKYVTGTALNEWKRLLPFMKENEFDKEQYLMPYTNYCIAVKHYEESIELINDLGLTVDGRNESLVKNPAFTTLKESSEQIARASRAFGFTPGDLKRLNAEIEKEELPAWAVGL